MGVEALDISGWGTILRNIRSEWSGSRGRWTSPERQLRPGWMLRRHALVPNRGSSTVTNLARQQTGGWSYLKLPQTWGLNDRCGLCGRWAGQRTWKRLHLGHQIIFVSEFRRNIGVLEVVRPTVSTAFCWNRWHVAHSTELLRDDVKHQCFQDSRRGQPICR